MQHRHRLLIAFLLWAQFSFAQDLTTPPNGDNKKAVAGETIGITDVLIRYHRPAVRGREGKIYGTNVVHKGFIKPFIGTSKGAPWRAGANENTTISFSTDVKVEGQPLAAGTYGFFIAYDENESIVIFSKRNSAWGHFYYNEQEDALRVKVRPVKLAKSEERLKFDFTQHTPTSAVVVLSWESLAFPFKVEVNLVKTQLESFSKELSSDRAIGRWEPWNYAAYFCLEENVNLEEALQWINQGVFWSGPNFTTYTTKADILEALNKKTEADSLRQAAFKLGTPNQLYSYGRNLIRIKKPAQAMNVFQFNATKNPGQFLTSLGLARGYSANGDYTTALKHAKEALLLAPNANNKTSVEAMIKKLQEGKDIN